MALLDRALNLVSIEAFLDSRDTAKQKAELVGGVIHLMAGATDRHNKISINAVLALGPPLGSLAASCSWPTWPFRSAKTPFTTPM